MTVNELLACAAKVKRLEIRVDQPGRGSGETEFLEREPYIDNWFVGDCRKCIPKEKKYLLRLEVKVFEIHGEGDIYIIAEGKNKAAVEDKTGKEIVEADYKELPGQIEITDLLR